MKKLILGLYTFLAAASALAQNQSQVELISRSRRPVIEDVLANRDNLIAYRGSGYNQAATKVEGIKYYLPELIVSLEKAFPGGTYGFLGRDMDLIADAVDAYYLSIGQKNRVKRVEFSTPSLRGSTPELITEFLTQLGLDDAKEKTKGTFVLIDYTSFAPQGRTDSSFPSQARHIYQSVIRNLESKGLSSEEIVSRVNIATLDSSAYRSATTQDPLSTSFDRYLATQAEELSRYGAVRTITYLNVGNDSMAYYSEWNDKYGPIVRTPEGKLMTYPSSQFTYEVKSEVFRLMVDTLNIVLSPEMKNRIATLAEHHKVKFEARSEIPNSKKNLNKTNADKNLKDAIKIKLSELAELPAEREYTQRLDSPGNYNFKLTENGLKVFDVLKSGDALQAKKYFEISLNALVKLYKENKIGVRDFRRIFAGLLTMKTLDEPKLIEKIAKNYKDFLPLETLFGRESDRNKHLTQDSELGAKNYKTILAGTGIGLSCKFLLIAP